MSGLVGEARKARPIARVRVVLAGVVIRLGAGGRARFVLHLGLVLVRELIGWRRTRLRVGRRVVVITGGRQGAALARRGRRVVEARRVELVATSAAAVGARLPVASSPIREPDLRDGRR